MPRERRNARGWTVTLLCSAAMLGPLLAAQQRDSAAPDWAAAAVQADALFGGAAGALSRLQLDAGIARVGDPGAHAAYLAEWRPRLDAAAIELVRTHATPELWAQVPPFFAEAGHALRLAELSSLCGYLWAEEFPESAAKRFGDAKQVGASAIRELSDAQREVLDGTASISPQRLALTIGAARLSVEHAQAIAAFYGSPAGQQWLAVRKRAWPAAEKRYAAFLQDGFHRGLLRLPLAAHETVVELFMVERGKPVPPPPGIDLGGIEPRLPDKIGWRIDGTELRTEQALLAHLRQLQPARVRLRPVGEGIQTEHTRRLVEQAGCRDVVDETDPLGVLRGRLPAYLPTPRDPEPRAPVRRCARRSAH
jgi:hypothetical protein